MHELTLQQLPQYTPWVARLLDLESFSPVNRSTDKVHAEYDQVKYKKCLEGYQRSLRTTSVEDVKQGEFGLVSQTELCISIGDRLYVTTLAEARASYYKMIAETLEERIRAAQAVVELGAGYGFNLHLLHARHGGKRFRGGEYSANAVSLAEYLYAGEPDITVERFNFYDSEYELLRGYERGTVLVFTSHAIEQLPSARHVVERIKTYPCVREVIHFEPAFEMQDSTTMLGLMRQKYARINDYNRDLMSSLRYAGVRITRSDVNVFGMNPLNPTSIIGWTTG
jgi:hypothetical protein